MKRKDVTGLQMAAFKVYGREGHRQRESFGRSYWYDFSYRDEVRVLEVFNSDMTGTNDYTVVRIFENTLEDCIREFDGQLTDGIFENSAVGKVEDATSEYSLDRVPLMLDEMEGD